ncbi:hypothetical protein ACX40Y_15630 [Sphingomonas sp. RS6]
MKLLPIIVGPMLLAACGSDPANENSANAVAPVPSGPMLGKVDLSAPLRLEDAAGTWSMVLAPGRIMFQPRGADPIPFYPRTPVVDGNSARIVTETPDGDPVTIRLVVEPCGPEDARAPLTASLQIAARVYQGCAQPLPIEQIRYDMYNEAMAVPYNATADNAVD